MAMNNLPRELQISVLHHLVRKNGINDIQDITKVSKNTILRLLERAGTVCKRFQDQKFHNLNFKRIQSDEIWTFCYAKKKNATPDLKERFLAGDAWVWTAIDTKSRVLFSYLVGGTRDQHAADSFLSDVQSRLSGRFQLTTDGNKYYLDAIEAGIIPQNRVDYGILQKTYKMENGKRNTKNLNIEKINALGNPKEKHISTSYVERYNLTIRTNVSRFIRKTNGFTKKFENLEHHLALFTMYYNFIRPHMTFKTTPAVVAGLVDAPMSLGDIVDLISNEESEYGYAEVA